MNIQSESRLPSFFKEKRYSFRIPMIGVDYRWLVIALCLLVLFLSSKGFGFRIFESIFSNRIFIIGGVERIVIIFIFSLLLFLKGKALNHYGFYLKSIVLLVLIAEIPTLIFSVGRYNQPLDIILVVVYLYSVYLLFGTLVMFSLDFNWIDRLIRSIIYMILAICFIQIIALLLGSYTDIFSGLSYRIDRPRVTAPLPLLTPLAVFYFASCYKYSKKVYTSILYIGLFLMMIYYNAYFLMGRFNILKIALTLAVMCIFLFKGQKRYVVLFSILLISIIYVISGATLISDLYYSVIDEIGSQTESAGSRIFGFQYYLVEYINTYGLGFGLLTGVRETLNPIREGQLLYGFNLADLGIFQILFTYGFFGVIFVAFLGYKVVKDLSFIEKNGDISMKRIATGLKYFVISEYIFFPACTAFLKVSLTVGWSIILFATARMLRIIRNSQKGALRNEIQQ